MNKSDFEVHVSTPLFRAGAELKGADLRRGGIRAPSLRGALRFWFRAMRGKGIATAGGKSYGY